EVAGEIIAANHVDDDVHAAAAGKAVDLLDEVLGRVIDRRRGAELERPGAFFIAATGNDYVQPEQPAERDRHRPDAAGPAVDEYPVAVGGKAALEQIDPDGEQGLGHRRGFDGRECGGDRKAGAHRCDAIFGIAAAADQSADLLTNQRVRARARGDHLAGDFEPEDVGCTWRRR